MKLVCGSDGITYNNPCLAGCENVEVVKGCRCEDQCPSLVEEENADYDPELPRIDPPVSLTQNFKKSINLKNLERKKL